VFDFSYYDSEVEPSEYSDESYLSDKGESVVFRKMDEFQGRFSLPRVFLAIGLFVVLVMIALFVKDSFIRPFLGDVLVVIWLYCLVSSVWALEPKHLVALLVVFAFMIEVSQYLQILRWLDLESYAVLRIVLGATFDWLDLLAYSIGGITCLVFERIPAGFYTEKRDCKRFNT